MKAGIKKGLCILTVAALAAGGIQRPVAAENADRSQLQNRENIQSEYSLSAEENGVTVSTTEQFMAALQQHKSPITIAADTIISIGNEADTDGRMLPVKIPAGTVVRGVQNSSLNSRSPIQLEGDACFQNMELTFDSSDALGSVPHREIFLAGHSLTFDNVSTWLAGAPEIGALGGTEEELLPTVYSGGYSNTQVGENASLTVQNSNDKTMFQAIYMGHDAERDNKVPYRGTAVLNLDAKVTVRGRVDVSKNSQAQVNIVGNEHDNVKTKEYYGNENTTLTLCRGSINGATVENVGNLVVTDNACLVSKTENYRNVTLQRGGCLDLSQVNNILISGDFAGVDNSQDERGILVLNISGLVTIGGKVTGITQFQTENHLFPGLFTNDWPYISASKENASMDNFVLSKKSVENDKYQLDYNEGKWSVSRDTQEKISEIGEIEIVSAPSEVNVSKIIKNDEDTIPDENSYFEIIWRDTEGNVISDEEVEYRMLYESDYSFKIKTEYWESEDPDILEKEDWGNALILRSSTEHPGKYYIQAEEWANPGEYTFLFCSRECTDVLNTVRDVKGLKDVVKAQCTVNFVDGEPGPTPAPSSSPEPTLAPTPAPSSSPEPTLAPTLAPSSSPEPTLTPTLTPSSSPEPTLAPTLTPVHTPVLPVTESLTPSPDHQPQKVVLSSDKLVYTGKEQKPAVKVTDAAGNIISSEKYTLLYQNNIKVGRASVTVVFNGDYGERITKFFDIITKKIKSFRLIPKSKGLLVKWKKQTTQTTGYEIQYSKNKKFAKRSTRVITVKNNKIVSKMISRRKAGKRCYVRIRTYKVVKVDGKTMKFYSGWSKVRSGKGTK